MRSPGTILAGDGGTGAAILSVGDQDTSAGMMTVEIRPGADAASATADAAQELTCSAIRGVRTALSSARATAAMSDSSGGSKRLW
jgi:hypothetical protein